MTTISIQCVHCNKRYNAPATMAGKKVKCKHCGKVFAIPAIDNAEGDADLSQVGEAHESLAGAGGVAKGGSMAGAAAKGGGGGKLNNPGAGYASRMARNADAEVIDYAEKQTTSRLRPSVPLDFPGAEAIDGFAPLLLIVLGLGWLALSAFNLNTTGVAWVSLLRLVVLVGLCAGVAFPVGYWAVRIAGRKCRFMLPSTPGLRAFGAFSFPFALSLGFWLANGTSGMLVFGCLLGALLACLAVWFLFRIQPPEMSTALGASAGAVVVSAVVGYLVLFGINTVFESVARRSANNQFATSPMGPFEWNVQVGPTNVEPKPHKVVAIVPETQPATTTAPAPTTAKTIVVDVPQNTDVVPTVPDKTGTPAPPTTATTTSPDRVSPRTVASATNPPKTVETTQPPKAELSPLVASVTPVEGIADYDKVVFATGMGTATTLAAVKTTDTDENVTFYTGNPPVKKAEAKFDVEKDVKQSYFISPTGLYFSRMTKFPNLGVQLYDINTGRDHVVRLDPAHGEPQMLGFAFADHVVMLWDVGGQVEVEVINHKGASPTDVAVLRLKRFEHSACNPTISPDGRQLAVAAYLQEKGGIDLWDLSTSRKAELKTCWVPITNWVKPSAMTYGPMGALSAYFEPNGRGIMYAFRAGEAGMPAHEFPYRTLPYPAGTPESFTGRALDYVDANTWLLFGRPLIDTESGKVIGDLGIPGARAQHVVDKETLLIDNCNAEGKRELLLVKLKPDAIAAERAKVRGGGRTAPRVP